MDTQRVVADAVIVGGGVAGLMTALTLAGAGKRVTVLSKVALGAGAATGWAQGGIAAALAAGDSPALHAKDTIEAAAGIADANAVEDLVRGAAEGIAALLQAGVAFDRSADGSFDLGREAAHGRRRILHAGGDATGRAILDALVLQARAAPGIRIFEHADARRLLAPEGLVRGVLAAAGGRFVAFEGAATVLASGGIGGLFAATTNPLEACGEGIALAAAAGARCADLEFVQFHPTALAAPGVDPMPLVTEALRGEGAQLVNDLGERYMRAVHPLAELAPRDVVARATFAQITAGRTAFLDARTIHDFEMHFPTVFELCRANGVDPRSEPIPVAPAAHYHMGGVAVDGVGRTSIGGLWACGEVSATGVHGANRLASNSLLEGVVFARRTAGDIAGRTESPARTRSVHAFAERETAGLSPRDPRATAALRRIMYERAGVVRDADGLRAGLDELDIVAREAGEDPDRIRVASLVLSAALRREESRGGHFRRDHPEPVPALAQRSFVTPSPGV